VKISAAVLVFSVVAAIVVSGFDGLSSAHEMVTVASRDGPAIALAEPAIALAEPENEVAEPRTTRLPSMVPLHSGAPLRVEDHVARPQRLRVPALDLDVSIVAVGVNDAGQFDVPDADRAGWYQYGPSPGEGGAAVIAAHVDYNGLEGAFFQLSELQAGHLVHLEYTDGSEQAFEVVDHVLYEKVSLPADDLFRRGGDAGLHLVTCGGVFDAAARTYRGNRVVTAVPVENIELDEARLLG
jgi:sortase (surface protein transpeptidase)